MRTCPICENDLERCQCAPSDKVVYLVVWWEIHECLELDSIWTKLEFAEKRVKFIKQNDKYQQGRFGVKIVNVKFDEFNLLNDLGFDCNYHFDDIGRSLI